MCFHAHIQLFQIFTPWGQCWNCVHLSSLHTRQELTLAFICAAGQWASLTGTFRPLRWLLSFLSLYHSLRLLFLCPLQPDLPFFSPPYFNLHLCLGLSRILSPFRLLSSAFLRRIALSGEDNKAGGQQIFCLSCRASLSVYVWLRVRGRRVICFPITACDPKTTREVQSIAGSVPAIGKEWPPGRFNLIASSSNVAQAGECVMGGIHFRSAFLGYEPSDFHQTMNFELSIIKSCPAVVSKYGISFSVTLKHAVAGQGKSV